MRRAETIAQQLQSALDSRVLVEQAKGVLAARADVSPDEAFSLLRNYARSTGLRLPDLARRVIDLDETVDLSNIVRLVL